MSHKLVSLYIGEGEYYTRTDVDNVIADLEKKIKFLQVTAICNDCNKCADGMGKVFDENLDELKAQKAQAEDDCAYWKTKAQRERHHKYKRCLAMAKWCRMHDEFTQLESERLGLPQRALFFAYRRKAMWWNKWHKRWLELAEKFKEAK